MRNELVISGLESLCVYMGSLREGRKTILFVSEGLSGTLPAGVRTSGNIINAQPTPPPGSSQAFFNSADLLSQFRQLFVSASRSNTSIYTFDPRGLAVSEFDLSDRVAGEADRQVLNESLDSLRVIADQTDGRPIVNRNDPAVDLKRMVRDTSAYYLLGYTTTEAPRDGKFHEIRVNVKRRDVDVRARKGYWAFTAEDAERASAPPKPSAPRDVTTALEDLAGVVEPSTRSPVVLWMGATRGADGGGKASVMFAWEPSPGRPDPSEVVERVNVTITSVYGDLLYKGRGRERSAGRAARRNRVVPRAARRGPRARRRRERQGHASGDGGDVDRSCPTSRRQVRRSAHRLSSVAAPRGICRSSRLPPRPYPRPRACSRAPSGCSCASTPTVRAEPHRRLTMRILNRNGDSLAALPAPAAGASPTNFQGEVGLGPLPPGDYLLEITATSGSDTTRKLLAIRVTG